MARRSQLPPWAKIACDIHSHPKVRKAGRDAREVFMFALLRNGSPNNLSPGSVRELEMEPWYLAEQLQMTEAAATKAVAKLLDVGLMRRVEATTRRVDDDDASRSVVYVINGWEDEWGRGSMTEAERKRTQRSRGVEDELSGQCPDNDSTCPDIVTREERRGEENRGDRESAAAPLALTTPVIKTQRAKRLPRVKAPEIPIPADWSPNESHRTECRETNVDCAYEAKQFVNHAHAKGVMHVDWNAAFRTWIGKSAKWAAERTPASRQGGHTPSGAPIRLIPTSKPRLSEDT